MLLSSDLKGAQLLRIRIVEIWNRLFHSSSPICNQLQFYFFLIFFLAISIYFYFSVVILILRQSIGTNPRKMWFPPRFDHIEMLGHLAPRMVDPGRSRQAAPLAPIPSPRPTPATRTRTVRSPTGSLPVSAPLSSASSNQAVPPRPSLWLGLRPGQRWGVEIRVQIMADWGRSKECRDLGVEIKTNSLNRKELPHFMWRPF